jgi:hypothetical protein
MRRSRGRVVLTVTFGLFALNAWMQVVLVPLGHSGDPPALTLLQALVGTAAAFTAWGSWSGRRWAPWAALVYGFTTAGMLVALGPLLELPVDARRGIWWGALIVLLFAGFAAWYLRRTTRAHGPAAVRPEGA